MTERLQDYEQLVGNYLATSKPRPGFQTDISYPRYRLSLDTPAQGSPDDPVATYSYIDGESDHWEGVAALIVQRSAIWGPMMGYPRVYIHVGDQFPANDVTNGWFDTDAPTGVIQDIERILWVNPSAKQLWCIDNRIRRGELVYTEFSDGATAGGAPLIGGVTPKALDSGAFTGGQSDDELMRRFDQLGTEYNCDVSDIGTSWGTTSLKRTIEDYYKKGLYAGRLSDVAPRGILFATGKAQNTLLRAPGVVNGTRLAILYKGLVLEQKLQPGQDEGLLARVAEPLPAPEDSLSEDVSWESFNED